MLDARTRGFAAMGAFFWILLVVVYFIISNFKADMDASLNHYRTDLLQMHQKMQSLMNVKVCSLWATRGRHGVGYRLA